MRKVIADGVPEFTKPKFSSFSVKAADGRFYWVTLPTPGRRAAQKAFATLLAQACGATCADSTQVVIGPGLARNLIGRGCGSAEQFASQSGLHYGSMFPADPTTHVIYDAIPGAMANRVRNREQFALARAVDCWLGNADPSHAVFVRQPARDFLACLVGFGQAFEYKAQARGLFAHERALLDHEDSWDQTMQGGERICSITSSTMSRLASEVPSAWWASAGRRPSDLIEQLLHRQGILMSRLSALRLRDENPTRGCKRELGTDTRASRASQLA